MKLDMNISERDKILLVAGLAIVLVLCAFKFGFQNLTNKADKVNDEVRELQNEYDKLYDMYTKEKTYKKLIVEYNELSDKVVARYPANSTQEYQIMFLKSLESKENWINTYTIPTAMTTTTLVPSTKEAPAMIGNSGSVSIGFKSTYSAALEFIKNVNFNDDKTMINSMTIKFNEQDKTIDGSAVLSVFAITGANRKPEAVNIPNALIGKTETGIFESDTFTPEMSLKDQTNADRIRLDNDLYVLVNPLGSSLDNVVVGFSDDTTGKSNVVANGNEKHKVTITISGSNGKYQAAFKVGAQSIQAKSFTAGDTIDILISSSLRPADVDLVSADIQIVNTSDRSVGYTVINDDLENRRIKIDRSGDVVSY